MYQLFGIPNCDTVKKARTFLEKQNIHVNFIDFKKQPPTKTDIKRWQSSLGDLPVNTNGQTYKKHKDHYEQLNPADKISFLCENSSMIKRPILEEEGQVLAFGFDEQQYKTVLLKK
ncbi:MAG TPA: arsenate reductase family protein [Bacteriovoracaceae bacterium]|nr:arsenate reductase family protein [Bacteriovoracaceae bacterium]